MTDKNFDKNTQAFFEKGNVRLIGGKGDLLKIVEKSINKDKSKETSRKGKGIPSRVPYCGR